MPRYNPQQTEKKWQEEWKKLSLFKFDPDTDKPVYSIDNPPSFTSGSLHMGHALNHTWIDFIARYKRMRGYSVFFPVGFDCHGLPTELKVETEYGVKKEDRQQFTEACIDWTEKAIKKMKKQYVQLGYSADWDQYYETHTPEYKSLVQYSLLEFFNKGLIYRSEAPVLWCSKCGTALAQAEVGYKEMLGQLWYVQFPIANSNKDKITIATTRPEFLYACVAIFVHPEDERYAHLVGKKAVIPYVNRSVPIIADKRVDRSFGTGAVYLCTFGDEMDVILQREYDLPIYSLIDKDGKLTNLGQEFAGLPAVEARQKVAEKIKKDGYLVKVEPYTHNVLVHAERATCRTPVELIPVPQWFIRIKEFVPNILKAGKEIKWYPQHMFKKFEDWTNSVTWDWIISRQRVYGTPIPFWYCENCGKIIPPDGEKLLKGIPVDPATESAPIDKCPKCGSTNIKGSTDVCDCWVDSSITPLIITKWKRNEKFFKKVYPVTLRPQGYDIIRTWAFYTIFRSQILTGRTPFEDIVVNGMVAGPDGKKMDKSHGNVVPPEEVLEKYGADCLRQWALSASLGEDYPLDWKKIVYASKFLQKYFNSAFFLHKTFSTLLKEERSLEYDDIKIMDEWILGRLNEVKKEVTDLLDKYEFAKALEILRSFWWSEVCDYYLEMIKPRVYAEDKLVGRVCYKILDEFNRLMAPFIPHITEEIYHKFLNHSETESVHLEKWPEYEPESPRVEEEVAKTVLNFVSAVRTYKSKNSLSLKEEISKVIFYGPTTDKLREFIRENLSSLFIKSISFEEEGTGEVLIDNNAITIKG